MVIIGLAGPKGVGKSTYANQLVFDMTVSPTWIGKMDKIRIMSFATPLKEMLGCIVHKDYIDDKEKIIPSLGVSARHCLQTLGTEWGRNTICSDIWINITKHRIEESDAKIFIIDDVRFDNEAKMIREMGGEVWQLSRENVGGSDDHISESGVSSNLISKHVDLDSELIVT